MSQSAGSTTAGIAEYLGEGADIGGPFAILGLKHSPIDETMIFRACQSRLSQINEHPRSNTPAADEVRLAVHTAASQLLDPQLRAELAKHWPEGSGDVGAGNKAPRAWSAEPANRLDDRLRSQALMVLGACGGWNARSRKRLGQFARMHRVSAAQLVDGILGERGNHVAGRDDKGDPTFRSLVRGPSLVEPVAGALPWALIPVVYVLMGAALFSAGYIKHKSNDRFAAPASREIAGLPGGEGGGSVEGGAETRLSMNEGKRAEGIEGGERRHYSAILFELKQARRDGVFDLEAANRFSLVGTRLIGQWTQFEPEELREAVLVVHGVLGGILNPETFAAASGFLDSTGQSDSVLALALRWWLFEGKPDSSAMSARAVEIDQPGSFDDALSEAFRSQAGQSSDDPAWWTWWMGELDAFDEADSELRLSLLLKSVDARLVDEQASEQWTPCCQQIVQSIDWGPESSARGWLMGVLVDSKVRSDRLSVFTRALVTHSSARGLGVGMVVEPTDSMAQRERYLSELRSVWVGKPGVGGDDARMRLVQRIELLANMTKSSMNQEQAIDRCIELARVNSAAWARANDNEAAMFQFFDLFDEPIDDKGSGAIVLELSSSAGDEQWATDARNLESAEDLALHIGSLDRVTPVGPKSAHALVYLAMQAPDLDIRALAEQAMLKRRDDPAILIALDRVAGATRTTRRMVELINTYAGSDGDLGDTRAARRAILDRLVKIGVLGGDSRVGAFEKAMDELYQSRAGIEDDEADGVRAFFEALEMETLIQGDAIPGTIRARLMVRLRRSKGPMQQFVAYQSGVLDLFAFQIVNERPALESRVARVLEDSAQRVRRRGGSVFVQMVLVERAMAELWLILLDSEGAV